MTEQDQQFDAYLIALKLEREGKQTFLDAAANTDSKLAKQTFEFLANEEDKHIQKIEDFYNSLVKSGGKEIIDVGISNAEEKLEEFYIKLESIKDEFKGSDSDIAAYKMALDLENGAEELYEEMYNNATDPKIKKFCKWLVDEESMHSRLLNSCLKFVEDPAEWFKIRKK